MTVEIIDQPLSSINADCEVVFVVNKNIEHRWVSDQDELSLYGFKGEADETQLLAHRQKVYVALEKMEAEEIRLACAKALKLTGKTSFESLKIGCYSGDECSHHNVKAIAEGFIMGSYRYDRYKSKKENEEPPRKIEKILISTEEYDEQKIDFEGTKKVLCNAIALAESVNFVRDLVNTPPDDATPIKLAEAAKAMSAEMNLECIVQDESYLINNNMNLFHAVSRASEHPPRLIHMIYKGENPKAKITLIGKGLTYDSGGLSLKPSNYMTTMKADKGGGCAVIGIMRTLAQLKLPFEVHGIVGATENMIGGNAYKPDDVIYAKNGKSVEIQNTDAEGRLVLADCLCYAQDLKPDYIVDMATLTGACVVALGEYTTGIMGWNSELKDKFVEAADIAGELAAELPFNRYLKKLLKSEIADTSNISSGRYGGAITAALFLNEFIEEENKEKWIHMDIAGPAFVEKEWGYNPYGASGAGVRTVVKWLDRLARDEKCTCGTEVSA